jgi:hypothetical protein
MAMAATSQHLVKKSAPTHLYNFGVDRHHHISLVEQVIKGRLSNFYFFPFRRTYA